MSQVRIGVVGLGFMGMAHVAGARAVKGGRVVAIATRDARKRAGDWTHIQGNFGPRGGHVDLRRLRIAPHADYHTLLADPDIDLIDVCLPTDQHERVVIEALRAGKHVIVEKPLSVSLKAADRMVAAAKKAGTLLMVAQVLPFFPEFAFVARAVKRGTYGALRAAHFRRIVCTPDRSGDGAEPDKTGGPGIDLHVHDTHFISYLCGVPEAVWARGVIEQGRAQHLETQYLYPDRSLAISCSMSGIAAKGLAFAHGFEIYFEHATLLYDFNTLAGQPVVNRPLTVITNDGRVITPTLDGGSAWCAAFTAELQEAVKGVARGIAPALLSGALARDALALCHLEAKSATTGHVVRVTRRVCSDR